MEGYEGDKEEMTLVRGVKKETRGLFYEMTAMKCFILIVKYYAYPIAIYSSVSLVYIHFHIVKWVCMARVYKNQL